MSAPRLTKPQKALLAEIKASRTGGLWIRAYSNYDRTATALLRKGLVRVPERNRLGGLLQIFYAPVEEES